MQTKGFAIMRRILSATLAHLVILLLLAVTPACAAVKKIPDAAPVAGESETLAAPKDGEASQEAETKAPPMLFENSASDSLASFGPSSGTVVGNRALELRDELLRLRSAVTMDASEFATLRSNGAAGAVQYHSTVAAITARLQNGTTRGNPILLRQWEEAENSLNEVTSSLNSSNTLQTAVSADASLAAYLLESIQAAFQLSGAVDEDHDQLKLLRDEVSRIIVQLDYLRNQVADDIQRQTTYLTTERTNLQALAFAISRGELLGSSLANRPVIVTPSTMNSLPQSQMAPRQNSSYAPVPAAAPTIPVMPGQAGPAPMSPRDYMQESGMSPPPMPSVNTTSIESAAPTTGRLLVLIRYNQPVVEYEQQLATAVSAAMQRQPDAAFTVVGVSPAAGETSELAKYQEAASRNAEAVKRSLVQLGLPTSKIAVGKAQTQAALTSEVHVYVR